MARSNASGSTETNDTMQAWIATAMGKPEKVLRLSRIARPTLPPRPSKPTYLIRIAFAALNPRTAMGLSMKPSCLRNGSAVPEVDFGGTIHAVSTPAHATAKFAQGSRVFGQLDPAKAEKRGIGTLNEWVVVSEDEVDMGVVPEETTLKDAACLGMGGVTSLQMMRKAGLGLENTGKQVLVNGASGGVGTVLIQLVKATGATVVAVCSGKNSALVTQLGADEVVDYRAVQLDERLSQAYGSIPFDAILDTIGNQRLYEASPKFLKEEGAVVSIGGYGGQGAVALLLGMAKNLYLPPRMGGVPRMWVFHQNKTTGTDCAVVAEYARKGQVIAVVGQEIDFKDASKVGHAHTMQSLEHADDVFMLQGFEFLAGRRTVGKIVVKVAEV